MEVILGDITKLEVGAIVNAANTSLLGGSGVDGAIHKAAGEGLVQECRQLGGCKIGKAKITGGYRLPARFIIHTVGPVWQGGNNGEEDLLAQSYYSCLKIALANSIESIAFPCISTGRFKFPKNKAASIAIKTCKEYGVTNSFDIRVIFCCFELQDHEIYKKLLNSKVSNR
jgi:O-acetyl-ADP-ribose deacetylase